MFPHAHVPFFLAAFSATEKLGTYSLRWAPQSRRTYLRLLWYRFDPNLQPGYDGSFAEY